MRLTVSLLDERIAGQALLWVAGLAVLIDVAGCRSASSGKNQEDADTHRSSVTSGINGLTPKTREVNAAPDQRDVARRVLSVHLHPELEGARRGTFSAGASLVENLVGTGMTVLGGKEEDALLPAMEAMVDRSLLAPPDAQRMRRILEAESPAMRLDVQFSDLESTLPVSARALVDIGQPVVPDHAFLVLPVDYDATREYPILLFLHGTGMNFQLYAWGFWRQFAHNRWIIAIPTRDGWGTSDADWEGFYLELIEYVRSHYSTGDRLVCVAGHSAGARAALRFAAVYPDTVGCVAALAGMLPWPLDSLDGLRSLSGKAVLVHCAARDQIVPAAACEQVHEKLAALSVEHEYVVSPVMDHFSILESGSGLHEALMAWAEKVRAPQMPAQRVSGQVPDGIPVSMTRATERPDATWVDLNGDGVDEWLFRGSLGYCGSDGCTQEVFMKRDGRWILVLDEFGWYLEVLPTTAGGYHELELLDQPDSSDPRCRHVFRWDGHAYSRFSSRCVCTDGSEMTDDGDCIVPLVLIP